MLLEATELIRGVYHVSMVISPARRNRAAGPDDRGAVERFAGWGSRDPVSHNQTMEGDGTALYIQSVLKSFAVPISRLARGLAVGSQVAVCLAGHA